MPNHKIETADVRRDPRTGRITSVRGEFELTDSGDADPVKGFLGAHAAELGLHGVDGLELFSDVTTPTRQVRRYQQTRDGIPIYNAVIVVQVDHARRVRKLDLTQAPKGEVVASGGPRISADDAQAVAAKDVRGKLRMEPPKPEAIYFPVARGLRLAWKVIVPVREPAHDWEVVVDAEGGAILSKRDLIVEVDGSGLTFLPNPVVSSMNNALRDPTATSGPCGFTGTPIATIDGQRVPRALRDLTLDGANNYVLEGPFVRIRNFGAPNTTLPAEANENNFNYSSSDERFGAVLLYHHIDAVQRYIQSLGITTAHNAQISADPHDGSGGAWFSPVDLALHFGNSGSCQPDRSSDADVPLHEYGHAIQNNQVPGWGVTNPITGRAETRAMGEGFGDILACAYFAPDFQFQQEVFEDWVFAPAGLRRVDGSKVYPGDWAFQEHADGEIWSAALWNIYRDIGGDSATLATRRAARDTLLRALILSHHALAANASMPDGAEALMETHAELDDQRGVHLMAMLDSFHDRGLLPCSPQANLHIRDTSTDLGVDPVAGAFWNSPDVWVRNADDNGTTPQPPEYGQDNWFYARVWNRGTTNARAFVVTFNMKTWAGTQFVYPADFVPCLSGACGFNLAPGMSTIVKAKWPASMIPAAGTHGCLLASVYTPVDIAATGAHVWEHNNLAQRNLTIVNLVPGDSAIVQFQLGHSLKLIPEQFRLEIVRPPRWSELNVELVHANARELKNLYTSIERVRAPIEVARPTSTVAFLEPSRVELRRAGLGAIRLDLARESRLHLDATPGAALDPAAIAPSYDAAYDDSGDRPKIAFHAGRHVGLPFRLAPRARLKLGVRVTAPANARPGETIELHVVQRNRGGDIVGGITIQIRVK